MTLERAEETLGDNFFLAQDIKVETSAFISRAGMQDIKTWLFVIILDFSPCISNSVFILAH